jgi:histidyl-tRNA synthetase
MLLAGGESRGAAGPVELFVALDADARREDAFATVLAARRAGLSADMELAGRSLKGQLKQADRLGARYVVILRGAEVDLRDMASAAQEPITPGPGEDAVSPDAIVSAALRGLRGVA